jgi:PAS domain S-box-containing protein/putative nucleotidyltransferase with HDIG domain
LNYRDITRRMEAEEALRESENIFRGFIEQSEDALTLVDDQGIVIQWSKGAEKLTGYSRDESIGKPLWEVQFRSATDESRTKELYELNKASLQTALLTGQGTFLNHFLETTIQRPDGIRLMTQTLAFPIQTNKGFMLGSILRDITERKQAEEAQREREARYRVLFEDSPISLWEEDYSGVKQRLDALRKEGITDFKEYFTSHPEVVAECATLVKILDVNKATMRLFGANRKEDMLKSLADIFEGEPSQEYQDELISIAAGKTSFDWEGINKTLDGRLIHINMNWSIAPGYENSLSRVIISLIDITKRRESEERVRYQASLLENVNDAIVATDGQYRITAWNAAAESLYGWKAEEILGRTGFEITRPEWPGVDSESMIRRIAEMGSWRGEATHARKDGTRFPVELSSLVQHDNNGNITGYISINHDITERKQAEDALQLQSAALNAAANSIMITNGEGIIEWVNQAFTKLTGYTAEEAIGRNLRELVKSGKQDQVFYKRLWDTILEGGIWQGEIINRRKNGSFYFEEQTITGLKNADGKISHFISIKQDISERKQAEERIQRQLEHLTALSDIDQMVISSFDLHISLTMILNQVTKELGVDAADVLLLNDNNLYLEYSAGIGFRTKAIEKARVRLGQSYAGRVALERQLIQIPNLKDQPDNFLLSTQLADEDFMCYFGMPLVAKGIIKGVLEVYHRTSLQPDQEWFDFLKTLAGQAVLAIDNAILFNTLQRSNIDLTLAYDATIEGWSRAMDLRDKETEGHTQRVTQMTMELAGLFGVKDEDLVSIRRGALLHDIGKMGVPDAILLKPGPLTDDEWVLMRKHPALAFEMLSPIHYLKSAIDIPYCHHEKWDGTGYPRGLKGEQIPLVARIFAIIDVWDALTSDRPYRNAWTKQKAIEYLRSEAGKHFDPQMVGVCLESGVFDRKGPNK